MAQLKLHGSGWRVNLQFYQGSPRSNEPPDADPHVRWCGEGALTRFRRISLVFGTERIIDVYARFTLYMKPSALAAAIAKMRE